MNSQAIDAIFTPKALDGLFPAAISDQFFEALFGDAAEGAYDISLSYKGCDTGKGQIRFFLDLKERPGCCLACNLTYGLPEVFSRHPVINIRGLVAAIDQRLDGLARCGEWKLGKTVQQGRSLHSIPLEIEIA